jgi:amino-acid N-acetyltransferase
MQKIQIRLAEKKDIDAICRILAPYARKKIVLPRDPVEVSRHIHNFCVAEKDGRVIGCCAFRDYGNCLFEIRSLAVSSRNVGGGTGSKMVNFLKDEISGQGRVKIFALTTSAGFFHRLGFRTVEKDMFPQKIWSDCSKCPKLDDCDEEAVMLEL